MRTILALLILIATATLGALVYQSESKRRAVKEDLVELLKVKYGIFNVDEWKKILSELIRKKVEELNVSGGNREEMRADIVKFLNRAVNDFEAAFHQEKSGTIKGTFESLLASQLDVFGQIRKYIPTLTDQVLDFLNNPANRDKVKTFIIQKLDEYTAKTFAEVDYTTQNQVLERYGYPGRTEAIEGLTTQLSTMENTVVKYALLGVVLAFMGWVIFLRGITNSEYLVLILVCLTLLMFGVLLPMIEIDARISSMSFTLLGEPITFKDQVLYYKSKSILEVVRLMLTQGRTDVLIVGILVLVFSVLFPVSKLICSILYVYRPALRTKNWMNIVVFKTGKWSMADVMVVAIFMAYIGFGGIITEQLRQLQTIAPELDILTTNQSSLQFGFYLFTSFTIMSLIVSQKIQNLVA